ncbi:MAG: DsbA family protein, partial [Rhodospirillales bacterium]
SDAPVTIIEYSSLGCPHCAAFHRDTLPQLKREYIDTGKAKLIYRDFPLGTPALAASMIARCAGREKYFGFIDILFRSQSQWSRSKNPLAALTRIARFGGMSEADVQACLRAQAILDGIRQGAALAQQNHNVKSTPTFLIEGQVISGSMPYEHFKKAIEKALKK